MKEEITVLSNAVIPLDLLPVLVTLDIGWPVIDDHALVSNRTITLYTNIIMISAVLRY